MAANSPADGVRLEDATTLFRQILLDHPLGGKVVQGWGGAKVRDFCEPQGWLGLWMLKAEINSMVLFGCRLWDVAYQASDKAAEGVLPVDRDEAGLDEEVEKTYTRSIIGDAMMLTGGLRLKLARLGLDESLLEKSNTVQAKPLVLPGFEYELSPGDFLPFPDETLCIGAHLASFSSDVLMQIARIRKRQLENAGPAPR